MLLLCAGLIGLGYAAFQYGYISRLFFVVPALLGVLAPVFMFVINQRKVVLECTPWNLKMRRQSSFPYEKGKWQADGIAGFRFAECVMSAPATCTEIVYDLVLELRNGDEVTLLQWYSHEIQRWIAAGISEVLGLDFVCGRETREEIEGDGEPSHGAEVDIGEGFVSNLLIVGITLVTIVFIVIGSFLWSGGSELKHRCVILSIVGDCVFFWSGKSWTEINMKFLKQVSVTKLETVGFYIGIGIAKRKWFRLGKAYAIELRSKERMTTTLELPFDGPECEWICGLLEEIASV